MSLVSSCNCLCPTHWSQVLSREWRCRRCFNYIWVINNFMTYWGTSYIRSLKVFIKQYVAKWLHFMLYRLEIHRICWPSCIAVIADEDRTSFGIPTIGDHHAKSAVTIRSRYDAATCEWCNHHTSYACGRWVGRQPIDTFIIGSFEFTW